MFIENKGNGDKPHVVFSKELRSVSAVRTEENLDI
jgi:hypothetical protein